MQVYSNKTILKSIIYYAVVLTERGEGVRSVLNKLELIQELKNRTGLNQHEAAEFVRVFFKNLATALVEGKRVEVRGFCSFFVKDYKAYTGRNPKTGKQVQISAKKLPFFKCGKDLKDRVDY